MLHVPATDFVGFAVDTPVHLPTLPKLHAWQYLRLRREAAGLTIDDVATVLSPRIAERSATAAWLRCLETRNWKARKMRPIKRLAAVYPLDVAVYSQLAWGDRDHDPQVCRSCGISRHDTIRARELVRLEWAEPGLCTGCADDQAQAA